MLHETTGRTSPTVKEDAVGVHYEVAGVGVSLFVDRGHLLLQLGRDRFEAAEASVRYRHDFETGTTEFVVEGGGRKAAVSYPAWWAELGLAPEEVMFTPEQDEQEDFLAYLAGVLATDAAQARFRSRWSREPSAKNPGRAVMEHAMKALNDPDTGARLEARSTEKEYRQTLVLVGYKAVQRPDEPGKEFTLRDASDLKWYLTARGALESGSGLTFNLGVAGGDTAAVAEWNARTGRVRFASPLSSRTLRTDADGGISTRAVEVTLSALAGR